VAGKNIIAPLGMDFDLSGSKGTDDSGLIYYNIYEYFDLLSITDASIKKLYDRVKDEIFNKYGDTSFTPSMVTVITWINCPRYPYDRSVSLEEVCAIIRDQFTLCYLRLCCAGCLIRK
jgi:hypothetical protein